MKYDVQRFLKSYMPDFYNLVVVQSISWKGINSIFTKHINRIKAEYAQTQQTVVKDATFYSIVISNISQDGKGDGMFDFFNTLFKSLSTHLNQVEKKLIRKILYKILTEVDRNYLNFIGELGVLNDFMSTGEYHLLKVEEKIKPDSNDSADFLLLDKKLHSELLVEVINIHLEERTLTDEVSTKNHIDSKLNKKIIDKFTDSNRKFSLQPVIWTKHLNDVGFLKLMYSKLQMPDNVQSPFVYFTFMEVTKKFEHHFERLAPK